MTAIAVNNEQCNEELYKRPFFFIKLEMANGASEYLGVTEKQISDLGIKISPLTIAHKPVSTKGTTNQDFDFTESTQNVTENLTSVNYQIVHPEDLNLKPSVPITKLPKGRPKKRTIKKQETVESTTKPTKLSKNIRTRSGRITKPPKHFEKDFKKIDLMETNVEGDIVAKEFEPLRTNEQPTDKYEGQTPLLQLQVHRKRRIIPGQYRCPTCNKAYLGQLRLLKHFQKNPDHGNVNENQKQHSSTWKFLIETALKSTNGSKAKTFCDELSLLVQNARILAKYLFKLSNDEHAFQVDELLSSILGILPGKYTLNENDLCKDVTLFSYLDMNYFDETYLNSTSDNAKNNYNEEQPKTEKSEELTTTTTIKRENENELHDAKAPNTTKNMESSKKNCVNKTTDNFTIANQAEGNKSKKSFNQIINVGDGRQSLQKVEYTNGKIAETREKPLMSTKTVYDLSNPLLSEDVEELILQDVGSSQNLLDNSSNSDDIMNVDQFVNERFKKLTEPEIDLSNSSLNLDLPSLELFQFHNT